MYKSKLQELCQKKAWTLPEYNITKEGQDHNPRFEATVIVNGKSFQPRNPARSSKEAQNDAAQLAFLHFTAPPLPDPDMRHLYKNLLQNFAQKRNLSRPVYSCEFEGPPHASRFRCKVTINENTYESLEFFPTIKEAEHAAAKIALSCLSPDAIEEEDSTLYKNLLQELAQKEGCPLPVYNTTRSGEAHASTFVSIVEVKGEVFTGQAAKTKKQAEFLAAKVAYMKLKGCKSNRGSMIITPAYQEREVPVVSSSHLTSNVNADTQQNLGSKANTLLNPSSTLGVDRQEVIVNRTVISHHISVSFPQPEVTTDWQSRSSSSNLYDHPLPEDDLSSPTSPSTHSTTTDSVEDSIKQPVETSDISCNRVVVRPRVPDMKFPSGSTVLPISDSHWVAVKLGPQPSL
ncbi:double-stranded RNA-binding protein 1-like isoform X2 [Durio zibethinus]|uniref:Double-stranded RNA-binding protein 1-like isoform X2 n=1 Tax=Durio zibethinus TaxID=66656 RepID=A0A6P5YTV5_DURZI|nr:double-stranded RNA-binding protein 1-like isoform X2 [Durio zibethinus]